MMRFERKKKVDIIKNCDLEGLVGFKFDQWIPQHSISNHDICDICCLNSLLSDYTANGQQTKHRIHQAIQIQQNLKIEFICIKASIVLITIMFILSDIIE